MKVVQINTYCSKGSTGRICIEISSLLNKKGIENLILHAESKSDYQFSESYCNENYIKLQAAKAHIFGNYGFNSKMATNRLIKKLDRIKPDIVHLHNVHTHECNIEILINYLKEKRIKVYWTFHDCWAFTGYCAYFDYIKCDKWKTECTNCPQYKDKSIIFDKSNVLFKRKKAMLDGLDLTVITPSDWLSEIVGESFLKDYPRFVINNGIDIDIFRPRQGDFREKYRIKGKMILGVAYSWELRKGIDVFIELSRRLPDDYSIVLVGADKGIKKIIPDRIITVPRTQNAEELAEIYSAADVFFNPTREDTYPTVNMEAIACGTPVVTFDTGGSPEIVDDTCGIVIKQNDINAAEIAIKYVCEGEPFKKEDLLKKAEYFDKNKSFSKYVSAYEGLLPE